MEESSGPCVGAPRAMDVAERCRGSWRARYRSPSASFMARLRSRTRARAGIRRAVSARWPMVFVTTAALLWSPSSSKTAQRLLVVARASSRSPSPRWMLPMLFSRAGDARGDRRRRSRGREPSGRPRAPPEVRRAPAGRARSCSRPPPARPSSPRRSRRRRRASAGHGSAGAAAPRASERAASVERASLFRLRARALGLPPRAAPKAATPVAGRRPAAAFSPPPAAPGPPRRTRIPPCPAVAAAGRHSLRGAAPPTPPRSRTGETRAPDRGAPRRRGGPRAPGLRGAWSLTGGHTTDPPAIALIARRRQYGRPFLLLA